MRIKIHLILILTGAFVFSCQAQETSATKVVGGPCQGCEAVHEYGKLALTNVDTLPGFLDNHPKLKITGTVFKNDEKTPASDVILYFYQTNKDGKYVAHEGAQGWERNHGSIRGWIKTNADGQYTIYTFRPGAYPNGREAEHIHITVKEPKINEYYIDNYVFDDDPLLTNSERKSLTNRGGSGIVSPVEKDGIHVMKRDIILGKNIPNYR